MTATAYTVEPLELIDGTVFNLRPLAIKHYRIANKRMMDLLDPENELSDEERENELFDLTVYCLKHVKKDWPDDYDFEDVLEYDTVYKVIAVCTGIDLKKVQTDLEKIDPEVMRKIVEMTQTQENGTKDSQN